VVKLILPNKLEKELKEKSLLAAKYQTHEKMRDIAQKYYEKAPEVKEWWIRIIGKRDLYTNKINTMINAADKDNKHKIDIPIQGAQMWYVNMRTNEVRLEWILPFSKAKQSDKRESVTNNNPLIEQSFNRAAKFLGKDLITGKPVKLI